MTPRTVALILVLALSPIGAAAQDWRTDFSRRTVPLDEIVPGGPPKDGIPAIDRPRFEGVAEAARWLGAREPVAVVTVGEEARAYPLQILIWHEIVNDVIAGQPVAVTYCPLCNTALAFDRRLDGAVLDFGTTGRLRYSDLVMYDRQTESWWQQATGEGIVGAYAGRRLRFLPAPVMSWRDFRTTYPDGRVLSRNTGYVRPYGRNPYAGYDTRSGPIAGFFRGAGDARLPALERVVAVDWDGSSVAYAFSLFSRTRVVNDEVGSVPVVVFWVSGTASALDAAEIAEGRDVGATAAFDRRLGGRVLSFEAMADGRFRDRETGTTWDLGGRGASGPLAGCRLTRTGTTSGLPGRRSGPTRSSSADAGWQGLTLE